MIIDDDDDDDQWWSIMMVRQWQWQQWWWWRKYFLLEWWRSGLVEVKVETFALKRFSNSRFLEQAQIQHFPRKREMKSFEFTKYLNVLKSQFRITTILFWVPSVGWRVQIISLFSRWWSRSPASPWTWPGTAASWPAGRSASSRPGRRRRRRRRSRSSLSPSPAYVAKTDMLMRRGSRPVCREIQKRRWTVRRSRNWLRWWAAPVGGKCELRKGGKVNLGGNWEEADLSKGCANVPLGFAIMVPLNILNCNNSGCCTGYKVPPLL